MHLERLNSELLRYLATNGHKPDDRLPSLGELSRALGVSVGKLREQLEVARNLGLVDVKPRTGIRREEYSFYPAVRTSLLFALADDPRNFDAFSALRNHVEAAFWPEAVALLTPADIASLRRLMAEAWAKLAGDPVQIPHAEHRDLHLTIFARLNNPFVKGLLEAYWEAYEAVELNVYSDYNYLREVWTFHERIVEAIAAGDYESGHAALVEHTCLLRARVRPEAAGSDSAQGD